jgi:hypothetical protein
MVFSVRSAIEATIGHLKIAMITKKEETATGQANRQGNASTHLELFTWNSSQKKRL